MGGKRTHSKANANGGGSSLLGFASVRNPLVTADSKPRSFGVPYETDVKSRRRVVELLTDNKLGVARVKEGEAAAVVT